MRVYITLLVVLVLMPASWTQAQEARPVFSATTRIDLGSDRGQNFGTLFEAKDAEGRVVAGAGFTGLYNTMFRNDRFVVQFFARPLRDEGKFTLERLPRPSPDAGLYLHDFDGRIHTFPYAYERIVRSWDATARQWKEEPSPAGRKRTWGHMNLRLGSGLLETWPNQATWNGKAILSPPDLGQYNNFYYALGHLIFFHTHRTEEPGAFTKVVACPWTPGDGPIDMSKAKVMQVTFPGETPFAYGQFEGEVLTCSNRGGVYAFNGTAWRVVKNVMRSGSFQVYSMLSYYDKLLLSQYPTGEIFEYDGRTLRHLKGWPPKLEGVATSSRECQTLSLYRGDLIAGVWPWGEVWRYDVAAEKWVFMTRLFSHPELTTETVHPYENECRAAKIRANQWGQRVTGMAPLGESLMLSTCAYGAWRLPPTIDKSGDKKWFEYGSVVKLTLPGNLAARIAWKDGPTTLTFLLEPDRMRILQDDKELATTALDPALTKGFEIKDTVWGKGAFGPFTGRMNSSTIE